MNKFENATYNFFFIIIIFAMIFSRKS